MDVFSWHNHLTISRSCRSWMLWSNSIWIAPSLLMMRRSWGQRLQHNQDAIPWFMTRPLWDHNGLHNLWYHGSHHSQFVSIIRCTSMISHHGFWHQWWQVRLYAAPMMHKLPVGAWISPQHHYTPISPHVKCAITICWSYYLRSMDGTTILCIAQFVLCGTIHYETSITPSMIYMTCMLHSSLMDRTIHVNHMIDDGTLWILCRSYHADQVIAAHELHIMLIPIILDIFV